MELYSRSFQSSQGNLGHWQALADFFNTVPGWQVTLVSSALPYAMDLVVNGLSRKIQACSSGTRPYQLYFKGYKLDGVTLASSTAYGSNPYSNTFENCVCSVLNFDGFYVFTFANTSDMLYYGIYIDTRAGGHTGWGYNDEAWFPDNEDFAYTSSSSSFNIPHFGGNELEALIAPIQRGSFLSDRYFVINKLLPVGNMIYSNKGNFLCYGTSNTPWTRALVCKI